MNTSQQKIKRAVDACNSDDFIFRDITFHGEDATLVTPSPRGTSWTQANKYLRSAIYRKSDYYPLSLSFFKFVNYGENVEHFPVPSSLDDCYVVSKEDGSTFIVDCVNDNINVRTRGGQTYDRLENADDFKLAYNKHPLLDKWIRNHSNYSLLFEIVTPNRPIVLKYSRIDIILIGAIDKTTYELVSQPILDAFAMEMNVPRPKYYQFDTIESLITTIQQSVGIEGCIIYSANDLHKVKSLEYIKLHYFKHKLNFKSMLTLCAELNFPAFAEVKSHIIKIYDWECWQMAEDVVVGIYKLKCEVDNTISRIQMFVNDSKNLSQPQFAELTKWTWEGKWTGVAFNLRAKKTIDVKTICSIITDNRK